MSRRDVILPVLDLLGGVVVRGVAGRRGEYQAIRSTLTDSADPMAVAKALRDAFTAPQLYLADLDAIESGQLHADAIRELLANDFRLLLDAGVETHRHWLQHRETLAGEATVEKLDEAIEWVLPLENLSSLEALADQFDELERFVFSLDLLAGRPKSKSLHLRKTEPLSLVDQAVEIGFRRLIVLDLAAVGVGEGPATLELCRAIRNRHPRVSIISGGGVRGLEDVEAFVEAGCDQVLVASALHNGVISPAPRD